MKLKTLSGYLLSAVFLLAVSCSKKDVQKITILETTDLHGVIMPFDYIEKEPLDASLANSATYIRQLRESGETVFLLDNGDNLQGQPAVYYYNFIDTMSQHFLSASMNWLMYDAATAGNHDIETGHPVYDRLSLEYNFPLLAANAVDKVTGKPYFTPFVILKRDSIRIAVLGLITPAVPTWLPEKLYSGMEFRGMTETAKLWMPEILKQKPDLVVGLFHSGFDRNEIGSADGKVIPENEVAAVAYNVPGFDIIFCGHDHRAANEKMACIDGDSVLILNAGSRSEYIAQADVTFTTNKLTGKKKIVTAGKLVDVKRFKPDPDFMETFKDQDALIREYVNKVIGKSSASVSSRDSYFGPSAFVGMIHREQLEITGADISFAAPLSFDVMIPKGDITTGDMFKLYRFENMLYTMELSGEEVRKYLEYSYSLWLRTMKNESDYLLNYRMGNDGKPVINNNKAWFRNQPYNFDSAAGIDYLVDVSKPEDQRIKILSFSDGRRFDPQSKYKVAVNSYRGNGGGGHLTSGVGLNYEELKTRVLASTIRDLRFYIMQSIEEKGTIRPEIPGNWKIVPEEWVRKAYDREYKLLFGDM